MTKTALLLAGVASLGFFGAAHAADLMIDEPAAVATAAADWTGFYIGGQVGYGTGTLTLEPQIIAFAPVSIEEDIDGFFGGVQIGYNWQIDSIVLGIDSSLALSGIKFEEDGGDDTVDWLGSTTARVGVALDSVLPYVKAGVAYAGGTGHNDGFEDSATFTGWTAGLGIEFKLADNISLFGEYDYYSFGDETLSFDGTDITVSPEFSTAKIGVNFKF